MTISSNFHAPTTSTFQLFDDVRDDNVFVNVQISDAKGNAVNLFIKDPGFLSELVFNAMKAHDALSERLRVTSRKDEDN